MLYMFKSHNGIWKIEFTEVLDNIEVVLLSSDVISDIIPVLTILVILILTNKKAVSHQLVSKVVAHFQEFQLLFHTDAAQVFKKVPVSLRGLLGQSNMVMIVGHKIRTPKGVSVLYLQYRYLSKKE